MLMAAVFVAAGIVSLHAGQAEPGQPVIALFPPWWGVLDGVGAVAAADGRLLRLGAWPGSIVAQSADPDFVARLHHAGAWLVLDPHGVLDCGATAGRAGLGRAP